MTLIVQVVQPVTVFGRAVLVIGKRGGRGVADRFLARDSGVLGDVLVGGLQLTAHM
jgi:hypothetical protein